MTSSSDPAPLRILGIDPGLRQCGWGVIEASGPRLAHVANGTVAPEGAALAGRLRSLHGGLTAVVERHAPDAAAVENVFVNRDGAGTLKLGQARGIALLVPAQAGLEVGEYQPNTIKKTVVGAGHAGKDQIAHMVGLQLGHPEIDSEHSADALAIAICHAFHLQTARRLSAAMAGAGARLRGRRGGVRAARA